MAYQCSRAPWAVALLDHVKEFRTVRRHDVVLHYAPRAADKWVPELLVLLCQRQLSELSGRFGFVLRAPVIVYLLESAEEVSRLHDGTAGFAVIAADAIVVGAHDGLDRLLRHELTHLFSARWNWRAPPILNEGLAVFLESTRGTSAEDEHARAILARQRFRCEEFLDATRFYSNPGKGERYILAGSFTGFLVHRVGWARYAQMFALSPIMSFDALLKSYVGLSWTETHTAWLADLDSKHEGARSSPIA